MLFGSRPELIRCLSLRPVRQSNLVSILLVFDTTSVDRCLKIYLVNYSTCLETKAKVYLLVRTCTLIDYTNNCLQPSSFSGTLLYERKTIKKLLEQTTPSVPYFVCVHSPLEPSLGMTMALYLCVGIGSTREKSFSQKCT